MLFKLFRCLNSRNLLRRAPESSNLVSLRAKRFSTESKRPAIILGIETSCDDTGCAVVSSSGEILGESLNSQLQFHLKTGGINPPLAQEFHRKNIENVVNESLMKANLTVNDVDAIAVTTRPGLLVSLQIGVRYAKHLSRKYSKPLIPIHHMEAHALMARIEHRDHLKFPFLCLLASGGHCLLAIVKNVNEFCLLGEAPDGSPGECFDKTARIMGLHNLPEYSKCSGGRAIELAAYNATNADRFPFSSLPMQHYRDCQFSFSGLKSNADQMIRKLQETSQSAQLIPFHEDFCAAFLKTVTKHILHRTQRAIEYCDRKSIFGDESNPLPRSLVFSGGVACNDFMFKALEQMASQFGYQCFRPPKRLCCDNGVMIAWNGVERWLIDEMIYRNLDIDSIIPAAKEAFSVDLIKDVQDQDIKCKLVKVPALQSKKLEKILE